MKNLLYVLIFAIALASCSNNAAQQAAAQKTFADSIANATRASDAQAQAAQQAAADAVQKQAAVQKAFADSIVNATRTSDAQAQAAQQTLADAIQKKAALRQSVTEMTRQLEQLKTAFEHATAQLAAAQDNLRSTSDFHLLRSSSERQAEIAQAQLRVTQLQDGIATIKQQYSELTAKKKQAETQLAAM